MPGGSKLADKRSLGTAYRAEYPGLRYPDAGEVLADEASRRLLIRRDFEQHPGGSVNARAQRLMAVLGLGNRRTRDLIGEVRDEMAAES